MPRHRTQTLSAQIGASMAAPASLIPHFGALFRGIRGLGASAGVIMSALKAEGIGPGHRVIDLGCGKGATALALARALRCHTTGIEACAAFLDSAQRSLRGREGLVAFKHGDAYASSAPWARRAYDAVIMLNMGPAARCAERAWPLTRPGGLIVIDDCFEVTPGSGLASPSPDPFRRHHRA